MTKPNEWMLQFFEHKHLPPHLAAVSAPFGALAEHLIATVPMNSERTKALDKLLEAKDAAVRAVVAKQPESPYEKPPRTGYNDDAGIYHPPPNTLGFAAHAKGCSSCAKELASIAADLAVCATCDRPANDHDVRHPFVPKMQTPGGVR